MSERLRRVPLRAIVQAHKLLRLLSSRRGIQNKGGVPIQDIEATYCTLPPSNQTLSDILKGAWLSAFPEEYGVQAGAVKHFEDGRVLWAERTLSKGLKGLSILELGPFEAYNTWQFDQLGAKSVISIETNDINYLKCLIVKEMTGLKGRFLYGDFIRYLELCSERFDIVWASGVLYHQIEPLRLIELISKVTDTVFIHTHYYLDQVIREDRDLYSFFVPERDRTESIGHYSARLHFRSYKQTKSGTFAGGPEAYSYWMEKEDIFAFLQYCGFNEIMVGVDHPGNPNGPAMYFLAQRTGAATGAAAVD